MRIHDVTRAKLISTTKKQYW